MEATPDEFSRESKNDICPAFTPGLVFELFKASQVILDNTDRDDVLLFIGQTANYLYHLVKQRRKNLTYAIPISGEFFRLSDKTDWPTDSQIDSYCHILKSMEITRELIQTHRTIIIDFTSTYKSLEQLVKILGRCFGFIKDVNSYWMKFNNDYKFYFINLVSPEVFHYKTTPQMDPPRYYGSGLRELGYLYIPDLYALANEERTVVGTRYNIPRSIPYYPPRRWNISISSLHDEIYEGQKCVDNILRIYSYVLQFKLLEPINNHVLLHNRELIQYLYNFFVKYLDDDFDAYFDEEIMEMKGFIQDYNKLFDEFYEISDKVIIPNLDNSTVNDLRIMYQNLERIFELGKNVTVFYRKKI